MEEESMSDNNYNENDIQVLEGLEAVRNVLVCILGLLMLKVFII